MKNGQLGIHVFTTSHPGVDSKCNAQELQAEVTEEEKKLTGLESMVKVSIPLLSAAMCMPLFPDLA